VRFPNLSFVIVVILQVVYYIFMTIVK
jgi:hypothetical protein